MVRLNHYFASVSIDGMKLNREQIEVAEELIARLNREEYVKSVTYYTIPGEDFNLTLSIVYYKSGEANAPIPMQEFWWIGAEGSVCKLHQKYPAPALYGYRASLESFDVNADSIEIIDSAV